MPAKKIDPALKARSYPISLRQSAIDDLNAVKAATGESHGAIVTRLVARESSCVSARCRSRESPA